MKNRSWIYMVALAAAGAIAGLYVGRVLTRPAIPSLEAGTSFPQPRVLANFDLVDTQGTKTSPASLSGHPSLVFFGFTHCPDVCPTTLAVLANVQKQVAMPGLKVVLISVDPERDTPEQLGRYISSFGGDLIGLTGPPPEIVKSLKTFGVAASRVDLPGGTYTMDHSATIFALDRGARIVAVFTPPFNAAALARDVERLEPVLAGGGGVMSETPGAGGRAFVALQHCLPQHGISRLVLAATRSRSPAFKNALIRLFVRGFNPDMSDAVETEPTAYASFNEFFTRALRDGARPVDPDPAAIVSPVDGTVSEAGELTADRLLQAKGHEYSLRALLAGSRTWERTFAGGTFATIYLAPYNYHRIHMPLAGELRESFYVPGRLFSVNRTTAQLVPGLFSRNERVFCGFDSGGMPWANILVGALNVGSMATVWHGDVTPRKVREVTALPLNGLLAPTTLAKGEEMARFNMGSTVILLFPPGAVQWNGKLKAGTTLRMGERIGTRR